MKRCTNCDSTEVSELNLGIDYCMDCETVFMATDDVAWHQEFNSEDRD